jgi:hypothetical protein
MRLLTSVTLFLSYLLVIDVSVFGIDKETLKEWYGQVNDPFHKCQKIPKVDSNTLEHIIPIVQVVNCDDPAARYDYNFKVTILIRLF